jgi:HEAT repeat protein
MRTAPHCVLFAAMLLVTSCAQEAQRTQEDSMQPVETALVPDAAPDLEQEVRNLQQRTRVPVDEGTRQRIAQLIGELAGRHESADTGAGSMVAKAAAARQLEAIGAPAIPYLIDAAATQEPPIARQYALAILQRLAQKDDRLTEFLPVFVRSLSDRAPAVRCAAIGQIGITAEQLRGIGQGDKLDVAVPYLVECLRDEDETVRRQVASCLIRMNREDLVPSDES